MFDTIRKLLRISPLGENKNDRTAQKRDHERIYFSVREYTTQRQFDQCDENIRLAQLKNVSHHLRSSPGIFVRIKHRAALFLVGFIPFRKHSSPELSGTRIQRPVQRRIPVWYGLFPALNEEERSDKEWQNAMPWNGDGQWQSMRSKLAKRADEEDARR